MTYGAKSSMLNTYFSSRFFVAKPFNLNLGKLVKESNLGKLKKKLRQHKQKQQQQQHPSSHNSDHGGSAPANSAGYLIISTIYTMYTMYTYMHYCRFLILIEYAAKNHSSAQENHMGRLPLTPFPLTTTSPRFYIKLLLGHLIRHIFDRKKLITHSSGT